MQRTHSSISDKASALLQRLKVQDSSALPPALAVDPATPRGSSEHKREAEEHTPTRSGGGAYEWPPNAWFDGTSSRTSSPLPSPNRISLAPAPRSAVEAGPLQKLSLSDSDDPISLAGARAAEAAKEDEGVQLVDEPSDMQEIISDEPEEITEEPVEISESPSDLMASGQLPFLQGAQAGPSRLVDSPNNTLSSPSLVSTPPTTGPPPSPRQLEKRPDAEGFPFAKPFTHAAPPRHPFHRRAPSEVKETLHARTSTHNDGTRMLNQYILLQTLGRGAFGLVLEAVDAESGEEYAIKELNRARLRRRAQKESARRAREVRQKVAETEGQETEPHPVHQLEDERTATQVDALYLVRNEIAIMKKVNHPNVVRLYEVLDAPGEDALYMVLELCRGGPVMSVSLDPGKRSKPLDPKEAHSFFRQIISGVSYLHANEIVHHDIKPDNILLTDNRKTIKLVDFGVSAIFDKPGDDSFRDGTPAAGVASPAFAAPEQFGFNQNPAFKGVHGMAADLWSMGVSLYCMLTGHLPFEAESMMDLYQAISSADPVIPESWSSELGDLIKQLLTKDPAHRIKMAQLREHPWVTNHGKLPLPPIMGQYATPVSPVTQEDLDEALFVGLHSLRQQFHEAVSAARAASKQHAEQFGDRIGDGKRRAFFKALRTEIVKRGAASRKDIERSWLEWREKSKSRSGGTAKIGRTESSQSRTSVGSVKSNNC